MMQNEKRPNKEGQIASGSSGTKKWSQKDKERKKKKLFSCYFCFH
jgi:hypothetical protein